MHLYTDRVAGDLTPEHTMWYPALTVQIHLQPVQRR